MNNFLQKYSYQKIRTYGNPALLVISYFYRLYFNAFHKTTQKRFQQNGFINKKNFKNRTKLFSFNNN